MNQECTVTQEEDVRALREHRGRQKELEYLWRAVIAFEGCSFRTQGRGKEHSGAIEFRYTVSRKGGAGGRHYPGKSIEGYGNEL